MIWHPEHEHPCTPSLQGRSDDLSCMLVPCDYFSLRQAGKWRRGDLGTSAPCEWCGAVAEGCNHCLTAPGTGWHPLPVPTMFYFLTLQKEVEIEPRYLGPKLKEEIERRLRLEVRAWALGAGGHSVCTHG